MSIKSRVGVEVRDGNFEKALSIFNKRVRKCGILRQYRENQYYTKPSEEKQEKIRKKEYNIRKK